MQAVIFLNKLNNLNLDAVAQKLVCGDFGHEWTVEKANLEINRYKNFLYLNFLFPHQQLTPTWEIDKVWHTHILNDTYQYIQDCTNLFGYILHHRSSLKNADKQKQSQSNNTEFNRILIEETLELNIWESAYNDNYNIAACVTIPVNFTSSHNLINSIYII